MQGLRQLPIERIRANRKQPRKMFDEAKLQELAASIKERGILQPIIVRRAGDGYELVAGERRWRAAAKAGLREIPAVIKELSDSDSLQVALIENLQRDDLDPLEEATAYRNLIGEHGLTQETLAQAVGKNRATISNSLRLLKLPEPVLDMLGQARLTAGHARALMTLSDEELVLRLAQEIISQKMSVRDAEHRARAMQEIRKAPAAKHAKATPAERQVEEKLQRALGAKVRLHHRRGKGRLEIFFNSLDELDAIIAKVCP